MEYMPVPNFTAPDVATRIKQMENYLYLLREKLELALSDIGTENLSPAFLRELKNMGMQLQETQESAEERNQRVEQINNKQLTVSDVLNSEAYRASVEAEKEETVKSGTGYVQTHDGTLICYGEGAENVTFPKEYTAVPVVVTNPEVSVTATVSGFTADSGTYSWVSIGRRAEKMAVYFRKQFGPVTAGITDNPAKGGASSGGASNATKNTGSNTVTKPVALGGMSAALEQEASKGTVAKTNKTNTATTGTATPMAIGGLLGGISQPLANLYAEGKTEVDPRLLSSLGTVKKTESGKNNIASGITGSTAVIPDKQETTNPVIAGNDGKILESAAGQNMGYDYGSAREPFQESEAYRKAMEYTNSLLSQLNGGRTRYSDQIDELLNGWKNRESFSYDVDTDPLFQQMLAEYTNAGKLAMQDTIGQAAALTGGYGSTYATAAGNSAYNQYLQDAYGNLPEYYGMAMDAYNLEGDRMLKELSILQNADATEYERLMNEYSANAQAAQQMYQNEYGRYMDELSQDNWEKSFAYQQAQDALAQSNWEKQFDYGKQQDALAQNNWEKQFNYGMQQDALAQDKWERQFAYGMQQDKQAQENWEKNFAYQREQDAQAQKNYEADLAYNQYVNELKYLYGGNGSSGSSSEYKTPTEKMFNEALAAAVSGGEGGFLAYGETIPAYEDSGITEYVQNRTTFTKTKDTFNGLGGVDHNDVVVDGYGKAYTIKELAKELGLTKEQQKQLTKLKKGETINLSGVERGKE